MLRRPDSPARNPTPLTGFGERHLALTPRRCYAGRHSPTSATPCRSPCWQQASSSARWRAKPTPESTGLTGWPAREARARRVPALDRLAVRQADDIDQLDRDRPPGRRDAHELPSVGAAERLAGRHAVLLGDHVLDRHPTVGEGPEEHRGELLEPLAVGRHPVRRAVVDVVGGGDLVQHGQVTPVLHLLDESPDDRLVSFGRHRAPPIVNAAVLAALGRLVSPTPAAYPPTAWM